MFESTIGQAMDIWIMLNIPFGVAKQFPVSYFFDWNGNDIFKHKLRRKMKLVVATICLVIFIIIQIIRELCCKTVRYVKPKRLIDKDD